MNPPVDTDEPPVGEIAQPHVREPGDESGGSGSGESGPLGLILLVGALVALGVLSLPALIVVLGLVFMIFMHELGHYLTAKRAGMKVTEFFIGFGPRIWSFTRGETEYGVKAIWAGAYVKIVGMNNLEEVDPADEARTYREKSYPARMSVAVAGSAMHFAMALVLLFILFAFVGQTVNRSDEAGFIGPLGDAEEFAEGLALAQAEDPDIQIDDEWAALLDQGLMPAEAAGLEEGDLLLSVDGEPLGDYFELRDVLRDKGGDTVEVVYERDGIEQTTDLTVGSYTDGEATVGFIGVSPLYETDRAGPVEAVGESITAFGDITTQSVKALVGFFSPNGLSEFTDTAVNAGDDQPADGPVVVDSGDGGENRIISIYGAVRIGAQAAENGVGALLRVFVLLNIFIGVFNLVPLLPLDGGHVAVGTYERIREIGRKGRYHADVYKLIPLTYGVILVLLTVGVLALYADIFDPVV